MKAMTCTQLGGACNKLFHAETFAEIAELSKKHAKEMIDNNDIPHMQAMKEMQTLMSNPPSMQKWFDEKKLEFEQLPHSDL